MCVGIIPVMQIETVVCKYLLGGCLVARYVYAICIQGYIVICVRENCTCMPVSDNSNIMCMQCRDYL